MNNTLPASRIEIYPTHIKVTEWDVKGLKDFTKKLSVWDKALHAYTFRAYRETDEYLFLPAGIPKQDLTNLYPNHKVYDYRRDYFYTTTPNEIKMKYAPRDDVQRASLDFLRAYRGDVKSVQKFLSLQTGGGKTYCAISEVATDGRTPIIFIRNNELKQQWIDRILEYTEDVTEDQIYVIAGARSIDKLMKMKNHEARENYKFFIATHSTINSYLKKEESDLQKVFTHADISIKIYDEAHLDWESTFEIDMVTNCRAIYLTATPNRSNHSENKVYQYMYKEVLKFTDNSKKIKDKIEKYHNVIVVKYKSNPSMDFVAKLAKKSARRGFNVNMYSDYLYEDAYDYFYEPLTKFLTNGVYNPSIPYNRKTMILVKQIKMVDKLYEDLQREYPNLKLAKRHSKMTKSELDENTLEDADLIVTTDSSMGTGTDIKGLEMVISTIPTSSNVVTTQILGRIRSIPDRNVYFVDFIDIDFDLAVKQLKSRISKVYKNKAISIKEITI